MPSLQLLDLPTELIREICIHLLNGSLFRDMLIFDDHTISIDSRRGLARLSRSCKALRDIVSPFLVRLKSDSAVPKEFDFSFVRYARDILQDPILAGRERVFRVTHHDLIGPVEIGDGEILDNAACILERPPPSRWIDVGDFDSRESEERSIHHKSELLTLILMNLPNLSFISLLDEFDLSHLQPRCLLYLKEADVSPYAGRQDDGLTLHLCDVGSFAKLFEAAPLLETLKIRNCSGCSGPLELSNLRSLEIADSVLSQDGVHNLLRGCGRLERFVYDSLGNGPCSLYWDNLYHEAHPIDLLKALVPASSSLQELKLVTTPQLREGSAVGVDDSELKRFTALRTVSFEENE
ncbi:hypothetical protein F4803DRAFT_540533 [Xylaria telfairii]|nr:hypothetical protein F4803DRAFT_540533 [Xylaria telfairii]